MSKRVAIVQSNYIPWKGYFDMINLVDEFILFDDVQYTKRDWRNRNLIKTANGLHWLTIPVNVKGKYLQPIRETTITEPAWAQQHWQTLVHQYGRAPFFRAMAPKIEALYDAAGALSRLSDINRCFLDAIASVLGIRTRLSSSMDYEVVDGKTERLLHLCRQAGATEYLSGPAARAYLDESAFADAGIAVRFMSYENYPEYPQLHPPFAHGVSILDMLFNVGLEAPRYMRTFG